MWSNLDSRGGCFWDREGGPDRVRWSNGEGWDWPGEVTFLWPPGGTRVTHERLEQEPEFWAGLWGKKKCLKGQANASESW